MELKNEQNQNTPQPIRGTTQRIEREGVAHMGERDFQFSMDLR